jgi:hypothetical protein
MLETCQYFDFSRDFEGHKCANSATTSIFDDERLRYVPICAEHRAQWDAHVAKWQAQQQSWLRQDRISNRIQWGCTIAALASLVYFGWNKPVVLFGSIIVGILVFIACVLYNIAAQKSGVA